MATQVVNEAEAKQTHEAAEKAAATAAASHRSLGAESTSLGPPELPSFRLAIAEAPTRLKRRRWSLAAHARSECDESSERMLAEVRALFPVPPEASAQGSTLYTLPNLLRRDIMRFDPQMQSVLRQFWEACVAKRTEKIEWAEYQALHMCLARALAPADWNTASEAQSAREDWDMDRRGLEYIDRERFLFSIFQLADQWTDEISLKDSLEFLYKLFRNITVWRSDRRGGFVLKELSEIAVAPASGSESGGGGGVGAAAAAGAGQEQADRPRGRLLPRSMTMAARRAQTDHEDESSAGESSGAGAGASRRPRLLPRSNTLAARPAARRDRETDVDSGAEISSAGPGPSRTPRGSGTPASSRPGSPKARPGARGSVSLKSARSFKRRAEAEAASGRPRALPGPAERRCPRGALAAGLGPAAGPRRPLALFSGSEDEAAAASGGGAQGGYMKQVLRRLGGPRRSLVVFVHDAEPIPGPGSAPASPAGGTPGPHPPLVSSSSTSAASTRSRSPGDSDSGTARAAGSSAVAPPTGLGGINAPPHPPSGARSRSVPVPPEDPAPSSSSPAATSRRFTLNPRGTPTQQAPSAPHPPPAAPEQAPAPPPPARPALPPLQTDRAHALPPLEQRDSSPSPRTNAGNLSHRGSRRSSSRWPEAPEKKAVPPEEAGEKKGSFISRILRDARDTIRGLRTKKATAYDSDGGVRPSEKAHTGRAPALPAV
eukprot:tig00000157_g9694.t1